MEIVVSQGEDEQQTKKKKRKQFYVIRDFITNNIKSIYSAIII